MQSIRKPLRVRTGIIACTCAGLLAGGAGAAVAAPSAAPHAPQASAAVSPSPTAKASITAHVSPTSVKAGSTVTLSGTVKGMKTGDTLTVQRMSSSGTWTKVSTTTVKSGGKFSTHLKTVNKGTEKLRVVHGSTHSSPVTLTIT